MNPHKKVSNAIALLIQAQKEFEAQGILLYADGIEEALERLDGLDTADGC